VSRQTFVGAAQVLGDAALRGSSVVIHPFMVAGWCGVVGTALNCLPVGALDGGRMVQVHAHLASIHRIISHSRRPRGGGV
jgi:membrane-associated protease RseP (regulator of RpoE activity)